MARLTAPVAHQVSIDPVNKLHTHQCLIYIYPAPRAEMERQPNYYKTISFKIHTLLNHLWFIETIDVNIILSLNDRIV